MPRPLADITSTATRRGKEKKIKDKNKKIAYYVKLHHHKQETWATQIKEGEEIKKKRTEFYYFIHGLLFLFSFCSDKHFIWVRHYSASIICPLFKYAHYPLMYPFVEVMTRNLDS